MIDVILRVTCLVKGGNMISVYTTVKEIARGIDKAERERAATNKPGSLNTSISSTVSLVLGYNIMVCWQQLYLGYTFNTICNYVHIWQEK